MPGNLLPNEYLSAFIGDGEAPKRQQEAFKQALDNRKFEIELYWKRAAYFWTFIGAAFAAYFVLQKESQQEFMAYVVTC